MQEDTDILAELSAKFPFLQGKMRIQRDRRIFVEVPSANFAQVLAHLYGPMKFMMLTAITGLDQGVNLAAMYHLARESGVVLNLTNAVPRDRPILHTVTNFFPAAECYERELIDLLGMQVEGLPPGSRYPLPDGWPADQYPLRKDWNTKMLEGFDNIGAISAPYTLSPEAPPPATITKEPNHA